MTHMTWLYLANGVHPRWFEYLDFWFFLLRDQGNQTVGFWKHFLQNQIILAANYRQWPNIGIGIEKKRTRTPTICLSDIRGRRFLVGRSQYRWLNLKKQNWDWQVWPELHGYFMQVCTHHKYICWIYFKNTSNNKEFAWSMILAERKIYFNTFKSLTQQVKNISRYRDNATWAFDLALRCNHGCVPKLPNVVYLLKKEIRVSIAQWLAICFIKRLHYRCEQVSWLRVREAGKMERRHPSDKRHNCRCHT